METTADFDAFGLAIHRDGSFVGVIYSDLWSYTDVF